MADPITPPATPDPAAPPAADPKGVTPPATGDVKPPEPKGEEKPAERQTLEQKLAAKKAAEGKPAAKPGEKPGDPPKADDIVIKLAEGAKVDEKQMGEFKGVLKELGVESDGAQKLFDFYSKAETARAAAQQAADDAQQDKWEEEITQWPDAEEKLGMAKKAILKLADEDTQAFFQVPFVGSNPGVVKFLAAVGKLLSEAPMIESNTAPKKDVDLKDVFPSMFKKS